MFVITILYMNAYFDIANMTSKIHEKYILDILFIFFELGFTLIFYDE